MPDFLKFADEGQKTAEKAYEAKTWKILIVDDESDIHTITELILTDFEFQGRRVSFFNAYSAQEARKILEEQSDIAVILLDVVMESQTAGLDLVKFIREEQNNKIVRIILRTGQPGSAPEKNVIIDYDINDYKHKAELTKESLDTSLISAIRAYRDLTILDRSRRGLKKIIEASNNIFEMKSLREFIEGILIQLTSLLKLEEDTIYLEASALALKGKKKELKILAGTGKYASEIHKSLEDSLSPDLVKMIYQSFNEKRSIFSGNHYIGYFNTGDVKENILMLEGFFELEEADKYLIELFSKNINIAFYNNHRNQESINARDEIIYKLGEVTERHGSLNTHHVKRVGEVACILARLSGLSYEKAQEIKLAAAMHDVGKIILANNILEKAGKLTEEELEQMRTHPEEGRLILSRNRFYLLEKAAEVAAQHHERWDGKGYPNHLAGNEISLPARIASISLIYDALRHDQPYRKAWNEKEILQYIGENSGLIFDPNLVSLFFDNYDQINEVNRMYPV